MDDADPAVGVTGSPATVIEWNSLKVSDVDTGIPSGAIS